MIDIYFDLFSWYFRFSILAPNVFHIGVEEKVLISIFDNVQPVIVKIYLQDFPYRSKKFSQVQGVVDQGEFSFFFFNGNEKQHKCSAHGMHKQWYL